MDSRMLGGRYALEDVLGRGGMGVVYRGWDTELGRPVAVKTVNLAAAHVPAAAERFRREARVTAALAHPHIVTVYDVGSEGDTGFLVMELLPGPTLADRLAAEGPLPVNDVVEIGWQVCAALGEAHARGIVHRDIKPANLAYSANGQVKVLDFGITKALEDATHSAALTATQTVVGSAAYLSPEHAAGAPVDARSDLYALGCVLMELLTGEAPFTAASPVQVLMQHSRDVPPRVRDRRPDVPAHIDALVADLLAKDPGQRPQTAADVANRLIGRGAAAPTSVVPPPPAPTSTYPAGAYAAGAGAAASGLGAGARLGAAGPAGAAASGMTPAERTMHLPVGAGGGVPPNGELRSRREQVPPRRPVPTWVWLAAGVLVAVLLLALWRAATGPEAAPTDTPTTAQTQSESPTQTEEPSPTTTTTPPPTTTTPPPTTTEPPVNPSVAALQGVRDAIVQAVTAGELAPDRARDLMKKVDDVEQRLNDPEEALNKVQDLRQELDQAVEREKVTEAAATRISGAIDQLEATLGGGGDG